MKWSDGELTADVPPTVVTVTSTVPVPAGEVQVIEVAMFAEQLPKTVAAPNLTSVAPVRLVPVMVTLVPPAATPELGETPVTVGAAT